MKTWCAALLALALLPGSAAAAVDWQPWSDASFARAAREQRPVFLYLEAVWCHWCHVMQKTTLEDPQVQAALARGFVAIKVDHDADPLLANRYRDYGWPGLIFLLPDGTELAKHAGYLDAKDFGDLLATVLATPRPERAAGELAGAPTGLSDLQRARLRRLHAEADDPELGGLRIAQKFMDRDSVEYSLAHRDDPVERARAERTLDAAQALLDPVWGGAYQYSTGGVWTRPHYEKIMRVQASYLRVYAQAWAALGRPQDRHAAESLRDYLLKFLRSPKGAFYVSQDADLVQGQKAGDYFALDDKARRARGMPRIDRSLYAQENGQAIEALAAWAIAGDDAASGAAALTAADWVLAHRALAGGGFSHGARDAGGPFLGDTLWMGRAFLQLHRLTGERAWLERACAAARFIEKNFREPAAGYRTAAKASGPVQPLPVLEENIALARFLAALGATTAEPAHRAAARHALSWLAGAEAEVTVTEVGILLADEELASTGEAAALQRP